jgi:hypothetical protein
LEEGNGAASVDGYPAIEAAKRGDRAQRQRRRVLWGWLLEEYLTGTLYRLYRLFTRPTLGARQSHAASLQAGARLQTKAPRARHWKASPFKLGERSPQTVTKQLESR